MKEKLRINKIELWELETAFLVLIGEIKSEIPKISPIFAILEPIIFPNIKPFAPLVIAAIEVKSSGAEVAIETTVKPTTTLGTPRIFAKLEQWSLSKSPPFVRR